MASRNEDIRGLYRAALLEARKRGFALNRQAVERLYSAFAESLMRIAEESGTRPMGAERGESMRRQIEATLQVLQRELVTLTGTGVAKTARDVTALHQAVNQELARRYGPPALTRTVSARFDQVPLRAIQTMIARGPSAANFETLIRRRITALGPEVDTFLGAATARGVSAGRASKDLASLIAREDPHLVRLLERANVSASSLHTGAGSIDYAMYGLDEADTKALRGLLYDARRIAVTESLNTMREANAESMRASPIVTAAKWQTSTNHGDKDVCDMLAQIDAHGYGPGFYPPDRWPVAAHPHCRCYAGETQIRRPEEWGQEKPPGRPLDIDPRDARHTAPWADQWTERERERNRVIFTQTLGETNLSIPRRRAPAAAKKPKPAPVPDVVAAVGRGFRPAATVEEARSAGAGFTLRYGFATVKKVDQLNDFNEALSSVLEPWDLKVREVGFTTEIYRKKIRALGLYVRRGGADDAIGLQKTFMANAVKESERTTLVHTQQRASNIAKLEAAIANPSVPESLRTAMRAKLDGVRAATRWTTLAGSPRPVFSASAHEAGHAIYYRLGMETDFGRFLTQAGVTRIERLSVSEYAGTSQSELFAEVTALYHDGRRLEVPASIREAYDNTLDEARKRQQLMVSA